MIRVTLHALLAGALVLGCAPPDPALTDSVKAIDPPRVGEIVEVQLRRDHLGAGAGLPISPTTSSINGAEVSLSGELVWVSDRWVVIDAKGQRRWISRDSVLMLGQRK